MLSPILCHKACVHAATSSPGTCLQGRMVALWPAIAMNPKDWSEGRTLIRFYPGLFFSNIPILRRFCTPWIKVKVEGRVNVLKTNTIHHFLWAELRVLLRCVSPAGNVNWTAPMTQSCANATTGCPCDGGQREGFTQGNLETPKYGGFQSMVPQNHPCIYRL